MALPLECKYDQMASWAWHYCEKFSQRSLGTHWAALKWWCDITGRVYPEPETTCMRRLRRVTRALALSDPTVEKRCLALTNNWLVAMQAVDGLTSVESMWRVPLPALAFWTRVRVAHFSMMRLCEHEHGLHVRDLKRFAVQNIRARALLASKATEFFQLAVGALPAELQPRYAANRKLKLRPARHPVLPIFEHVTSAGLLLHVLLMRLERISPGHTSSPDVLLFPDVLTQPSGEVRVLPQPVSASRFLARLRRTAKQAGMPVADWKSIECRSLRAGGCTDFFANGIPRQDIMTQGGWTSDTVDIYNRPSAFYRWTSFARVCGTLLQ